MTSLDTSEEARARRTKSILDRERRDAPGDEMTRLSVLILLDNGWSVEEKLALNELIDQVMIAQRYDKVRAEYFADSMGG